MTPALIPREPVFEVRCPVRQGHQRCDWRVSGNTVHIIAEAWRGHRAWHLEEQQRQEDA